MPDAGEGRCDGAIAVSPTQPSVGIESDQYADLAPLQCRYAQIAADHPERHRLREQLISGYLPVAMNIARRFAGRGEPLEDLIQVATVGLINAVDRFDPDRGSHFLSFAIPTITGEIRRYFRDHAWSIRVPRRLKDLHLAIRRAQAELSQQFGRSPRPSEIADRLGLPTAKVIEGLQAGEAYGSASLDKILGPEEGPATLTNFLGDLDDKLALIDDREALRPLLAELAPRQRTILVLRFFHYWTQDQIAEHVGVSQMQISRVLRQTLEFLHQRITS
jgi:RNA polymerase sigma-B factor